MFVSYVVRLRTAQLKRGTFAGEVVAVASGRRYGVASIEQLAAFLKRTCADEEALTRQPVLPDDPLDADHPLHAGEPLRAGEPGAGGDEGTWSPW